VAITQKGPGDLKRCPACGEKKICEGNFYRVASPRQDGWAGYCIVCTKRKVVAWQKANPEAKAASDSRHYRKSPERRRKTKERFARWAQENPEKAKEVAKAKSRRYGASPAGKAAAAKFARSPKGRALQKRHRETPAARERHKLNERLRRKMLKYQVLDNAGRAGAPRDAFTLADWVCVLEAFGRACAYCRRGDRKLEMDHIVPFVTLGVESHRRGNVAPACRGCNASKNDRPLTVFCADLGVDPAEVLRLAGE